NSIICGSSSTISTTGLRSVVCPSSCKAMCILPFHTCRSGHFLYRRYPQPLTRHLNVLYHQMLLAGIIPATRSIWRSSENDYCCGKGAITIKLPIRNHEIAHLQIFQRQLTPCYFVDKLCRGGYIDRS